MASYRFNDCDYCERGWFGTHLKTHWRGVCENDVQKDFMNCVLADEKFWPDNSRPMCQQCCDCMLKGQ